MEAFLSEAGRVVLSASRRTDIPAFYMDWFMARLEAGFFSVTNSYNRQAHIIPAAPGQVAGVVFWSKDYGDFLARGFGPRLLDRGLGLFFHFTVNSSDPLLEPGVPPLEKRLAQFSALARIAPPKAISWRFDPVCHYSRDGGPTRDNLADFERIADAAAAAGVTRCVVSFMDFYPKIRKRLREHPGLVFSDPPKERKVEILRRLSERLAGRGMALSTCCENEAAESAGVSPGACVDHGLLEALFGAVMSHRSDAGQRKSQGCLCRESRDVGDYGLHPFFHRCLYCYASPAQARPASPKEPRRK